jgi:UDP-N-acetylmuramyl pentapeptide phosphotransferase/UDP-N-acetylglucosamine-1-phosphate transferase/ribosomal protein L30E
MTAEGILKYLFIFAVGLSTAMVFTPFAIRLALRLGMIDQPDPRRVHTQPTPRGGGIAVVLAFHAACAAIFLLPWATFSGGLTVDWWYRMIPLSAGLTLVGLVDDYCGLPPWGKLSGQIAVALGAWILGLRVDSFFGQNLPEWADLVLTILWFVAIMNAFNLIDGMDGVAAGLGSIASAGLVGSFLLRGLPADCLISLGLMGACLGFLHYNFHPARVFLGDTGSMFIGFALAAISLSTFTKGTAITALFVPALVVGVPLFDTFLAVWRRSARKVLGLTESHEGAVSGGRVFGADKDHLHHRLHATGRSQRRVAALLYLAAVSLAGVGLLAQVFQDVAGGIYLVAFVAAVYVVVRHVAHVELWDSASALVHGLSRPLRRNIVVPAYILADLAILVGSLALTHFLVRGGLGHAELRRGVFHDFAFQVALPFVALAVAGMYRRIWSRARLMDFLLLAAALAGGLLVGFAISIMANTEFTKMRLVETTSVFCLALALMTGLRLFRRVAADLRGSVMARGFGTAPDLKRALVYGAGHTGLLFLHAEGGAAPGSGKGYRVVGFLDDDTNLHGRIMHGYPVVGGSETLETLLPATAAEMIVITANLHGESRRKLLQVAKACGVRILQWRTELEEIDDALSETEPALVNRGSSI